MDTDMDPSRWLSVILALAAVFFLGMMTANVGYWFPICLCVGFSVIGWIFRYAIPFDMEPTDRDKPKLKTESHGYSIFLFSLSLLLTGIIVGNYDSIDFFVRISVIILTIVVDIFAIAFWIVGNRQYKRYLKVERRNQ